MPKLEWYEKRLRKNDKIKKEMRELFRSYGVKFRFNKFSNIAGFAWPNQGRVRVNTSCKDVRHFIGTCFHELAHVINYVDGKYTNYHTVTNKYWPKKRKIKILKAVLHTGIHAEKYTDQRGEALQKLYYPEVPYRQAYRNADDREWFKKWMNAPIKKELDKLKGTK